MQSSSTSSRLKEPRMTVVASRNNDTPKGTGLVKSRSALNINRSVHCHSSRLKQQRVSCATLKENAKFDLTTTTKQKNNFVRFPELRAASPGTLASTTTKPSYLAERVSAKDFAHIKAGVPLKAKDGIETLISRTARQSIGAGGGLLTDQAINETFEDA